MKSETIGMTANGVQIATKDGDQDWPLCLACGLMKATIVMGLGIMHDKTKTEMIYMWKDLFFLFLFDFFPRLHCCT